MPGTIVFRPIEANITTKDKDIIGKMDPYLSFHLGTLKRVKGQVCKSGGQHPVWNDAITVEVTDQSCLTVDLKDKDMLIDDKIGSFEVDLREVESQGQIRKWYPIFRKNEPAGELLMEATFQGSNLGFSGQQGLNQGTGFVGGVLPTGNMSTMPIQNVTSTAYQPTNLQSYGTPFMGGGLQSNQFQQSYGSQPNTAEQFAQEALMRGVDPLNTQQNYLYNSSQLRSGSGGLGSQGLSQPGLGGYGGLGNQGLSQPGLGQNLTETPAFSGTDPLIYEGDVNRFSKPAGLKDQDKKHI